LHGLGFAGALREIGLPDQAIPTALLSFNVGVEAGQLLFVAIAFLLFRLVIQAMGRRLSGNDRSARFHAAAIPPTSYTIGILAGFWFIERTYRFFI
jgi:hypothetical protein